MPMTATQLKSTEYPYWLARGMFMPWVLALLGSAGLLTFSSCAREKVSARTSEPPVITVGTATVIPRPMAEKLTISSELVPYQEIDVRKKLVT
jgi:multidrug efflux pump subunit AcrA (membrane-fusion protein)